MTSLLAMYRLFTTIVCAFVVLSSRFFGTLVTSHVATLVQNLRSGFPKQNDVPPVKVLACFEALCPDCKAFVLDQLMNTFDTLGTNVMDLSVIPFGNAEIDKSKQTVTCQHGLGECDANSYEQCLVAAFPNPTDYLPVLECLYQLLPMGHHDDKFDSQVFQTCTENANLDFNVISFCHDNSNMSWDLQVHASQATPTAHDHVPWIEINGVYMDEERDDFQTEICKAYVAHGGSHPACHDVRSTIQRL